MYVCVYVCVCVGVYGEQKILRLLIRYWHGRALGLALALALALIPPPHTHSTQHTYAHTLRPCLCNLSQAAARILPNMVRKVAVWIRAGVSAL